MSRDAAAPREPSLLMCRARCEEITPFHIADRDPHENDPLNGRPLTMKWIPEACDELRPLIDFIRAAFALTDGESTA